MEGYKLDKALIVLFDDSFTQKLPLHRAGLFWLMDD
jgi:hypothetical protein